MENYIVINGRKVELTKEQLKALGIEVKKPSPFDRAEEEHCYYLINNDGVICHEEELGSHLDKRLYDVANYCTDKDLLQQQADREILNRLLWRYSMEHDGDKINWNDTSQQKHAICYDAYSRHIYVGSYYSVILVNGVYFYTMETAKNAIEEIVKPFMAEHPDFKW